MGHLRKNMQSKLVFLKVYSYFYIWDRVFKSGLSKFCGKQPSKKLKGCELFKPKIFKGSLPRNLLSPFLTNFSHFSCYSLMTYLMMLFICSLLARIWSTRNCEMGQKMACWFQGWKNSNLFRFTGLIILALLMWIWIGLFLRFLNGGDCLSPLNWIGALTLYLLLKLLRKIGALIRHMKFLLIS